MSLVPTPTSEWTTILSLGPIVSIMDLQINKPSPIPFELDLLFLSELYFSNKLRVASFDMPSPLSSTVINFLSNSSLAVIFILPNLVNLRELLRKFKITCFILCLSDIIMSVPWNSNRSSFFLDFAAIFTVSIHSWIVSLRFIFLDDILKMPFEILAESKMSLTNVPRSVEAAIDDWTRGDTSS